MNTQEQIPQRPADRVRELLEENSPAHKYACVANFVQVAASELCIDITEEGRQDMYCVAAAVKIIDDVLDNTESESRLILTEKIVLQSDDLLVIPSEIFSVLTSKEAEILRIAVIQTIF